MLDVALFAVLALLAVASSALVFVFRDMIHVVVALTGLFLVNSVLFLLLNQPLLAVIQIFVLIGGVATFLFVGVASAPYSKFRYVRFVSLALLWVIIFAAIAFPLNGVQILTQPSAPFGASQIGGAITNGIAQFYIMVVVMFGMTLGAIILLKRIGTR